MFTGLVQAVGRLERCPAGVRLRLPAGHGLGPLALGDSVAVDGVCLTVAELLADGFRADVSEETLARTALAGRASAGDPVNLEPALRLSDRLGGHLVSGHVDGLGSICGIERLPASWRLAIRWQDPAWGRYICAKASVAVDGISLTVAGLGPGGGDEPGRSSDDSAEAGGLFWIAVIPHTWASTTLQLRRLGDAVNLEADLLAKYTERLLQASRPPGEPGPAPIDAAWLSEHGWQ
ncbi:MAG: riboflavin synthase [Cyanobium sp.]